MDENALEEELRKSETFLRRLRDFGGSVAAAIGVASAICGIIYAVAGYIHAERALEEADRAWLAPLPAELTNQPVLGQWWAASIKLKNVGHEPALNVTLMFYFNSVSIAPELVLQKQYAFPSMPHCDELKPSMTTGDIIYPSETYSYETIFSAVDAPKQQPIFDGKATDYIEACVAYTTFGRTRHVRLCSYLLRPSSVLDRWLFAVCPNANNADDK